ncbi:MAG TPA: hypothetical protein VGM56_25890 [Byssovorax sp.]|jgi:hypothetical protein
MGAHASCAATLGLVLALASVGCGGEKIEPVIASSANHAGYALAYPTELHDAVQSFGQRQNDARKIFTSFKTFPGRLKQPAWPRVVEVVQRADEVGKSQAYVDRIQRVDGAHAFFDIEKDEFTRRVGGAAQYTVKKKNCDVEVGGVVAITMKETVDKQLEKELRDASEAHALIDRYKAQIKKENVAELEKQADAIEYASWVVHIDLVNDKLKIRRMLLEADDVKRTQAEFIEEERKWQAEKGLTDADKKESEDRIVLMKKSQAGVESAAAQGREIASKLDDEQAEITRQYDDALADLLSRLRASK